MLGNMIIDTILTRTKRPSEKDNNVKRLSMDKVTQKGAIYKRRQISKAYIQIQPIKFFQGE